MTIPKEYDGKKWWLVINLETLDNKVGEFTYDELFDLMVWQGYREVMPYKPTQKTMDNIRATQTGC